MIEHGHSFGEIRCYTLGQVAAFTEAAARAKRRRMTDEVMNLRAAQYDESGFKSYLKALTD